jgi:anti-anti-sigma factor
MSLRNAVALPNVTYDGSRAIIAVTDVHFGNVAERAPGEHLYQFVEELGQSDVVLDFANVQFLNSVGLTILITLNKQLRAAEGRLILINVQPAVREVFAATRLDTLLEIGPASLDTSA